MLTLASPGRIEIEIRRSRFVAHAARVDSEPDTLAFYESVADSAATHNCWAWKIDHRCRFNDDGEPASTAGRPILGAIEGKAVEHAMHGGNTVLRGMRDHRGFRPDRRGVRGAGGLPGPQTRAPRRHPGRRDDQEVCLNSTPGSVAA
jgi:hypothetical protein